MSQDDVLFGYRLQLFDYAARTSVVDACRVFGVHRSTYYAWKRRIERHGLGILRPRERRRPRMPNQLSPLVEQRVVAFALAHPGLGPARIAAELAKPRWGGLAVSHNGVWRCLRRHGLNTRAKRLALVAGYAAAYEPPREPEPERHVEADRPGELVGIDCFHVGRLAGTKGAVWQLSAIDVCSSFAWAELVSCPKGNPTGEQTSKLARRVAAQLRAAGWKLERVLTDNGGEFRSTSFRSTLDQLGARHAHPRRSPPDQRRRRVAPPNHPRRMLATSPSPATCTSASPGSSVTSPTTSLQPRARPRRPHPRPHPRRDRLRCTQGAHQMSRHCRHVSVTVQPKTRLRSQPRARRAAASRWRRKSRSVELCPWARSPARAAERSGGLSPARSARVDPSGSRSP
jgi:transposase